MFGGPPPRGWKDWGQCDETRFKYLCRPPFTFRRGFESRCGRLVLVRFQTSLNIWPPTLTSKPRCLVCVPLWPAAYAILRSTRLYMWTTVIITHLFVEVIQIFFIFTVANLSIDTTIV